MSGPGPSPGNPPGSWPGAGTRLVGVVGHPIRHSLSPRLHNAAFAALGLDWASVAFEVPAGRGAGVVDAVATLGMAGLSVTMPLKEEVAAACHRLSPTAARLRAANCLVLRDGEVWGENTDGDGLLRALAAERGFRPAGRRCLVLGAGGAARAVVEALGRAGAAEVVVVARRPGPAAAAAALAGAAGRVGQAAWARRADLVVQATPLGMAAPPLRDPAVGAPRGASGPGGPALPLDPDLLGPGQLAVDLVYHPPRTPWLQAVAERGAATMNGLGMLVHQAALALEHWTGRSAPLAAMWAAVAEVAPGASPGSPGEPVA
jgi:shikimate dehydrogenase